ncbi:alpha/beta hydrolase [Bacillaceae bacterium W0354]
MYESLVSDAKGVVVVVHGAFEHSGRYDWVIDQLNKHDYHVVYGDLPGQGRSESKKGYIESFQQYIETVSSWVDRALQFELPVFLFGHSMGGLISIRLMEQKNLNIHGVILSSPALGIVNGLSKPLYHLSKILNVISPTMKFPTGIESQFATRNKAYHARDEVDPLFLRKVSVRWYHEFERAIRVAFDEINRYPDIPTLLLQSGQDKLVHVSEVERWFNQLTIENKTLKIWDELYHELLNEPEREDVLKDVIQFIESEI